MAYGEGGGGDWSGFDEYREVWGSGASVHDMLLARKIPVIESLANLDTVKGMRIFFISLPLKLKGTDGAPARAVSIELKDIFE